MSFRLCKHSIPITVDEPIDLESIPLRTPTSDASHIACIDCLEEYAHFVDDLPWRCRAEYYHIYPRESASKFVIECISRGTAPSWQKFKAIKWCIRWGWKPWEQVFEFVNWNIKQTRWLVIHGCIPSWDKIEEMIQQRKFTHLKTILRHMPVETFDSTYRFFVSTKLREQFIHGIIVQSEILGINHDIPQFVGEINDANADVREISSTSASEFL
jgi:hypothetical protein